MEREIVIPYAPRNWARELHNSKQRWKVLVLHRRAGKTVAVINHLIKDAILTPNARFAYIAPTYKQAKNIAWDYLKYYARPIPGMKPNESELKVEFHNGTKIQLFGSENIDALRGMALWGGAQDESSQQPSNLFSEVISKCLADHLGYWIWLGTPKGKNLFYRTYRTSINNQNYFSMFRTIDNSLANEQGETINNLRQALADDRELVANGEMTQEEFDQEWYCSFEAAIRGAYYAKQIAQARVDGRIKLVPYDEALKVHTVWDLGVGKNLAIGFYQKILNEARMIDYWEGTANEGIKDASVMLQNKGYLYGKHFAPHDINAKEITTGKTRIDTAKEFGVKFNQVPMVKVEDGIEKGRLFWSRLWVNEEKCATWLDGICQYRQEWDDKKNMFIEKPYHDWTSHKGDVHRYAALVENQMTNEESSFERTMNRNEQNYIPNPYV
jgi:phage terminase large subunit